MNQILHQNDLIPEHYIELWKKGFPTRTFFIPKSKEEAMKDGEIVNGLRAISSSDNQIGREQTGDFLDNLIRARRAKNEVEDAGIRNYLNSYLDQKFRSAISFLMPLIDLDDKLWEKLFKIASGTLDNRQVPPEKSCKSV